MGVFKGENFKFFIKVDFGDINVEECVSTKLRSGSLGERGVPTLADGDVTPCVSWVNKYWN